MRTYLGVLRVTDEAQMRGEDQEVSLVRSLVCAQLVNYMEL
jgi:hypothetical protein